MNSIILYGSMHKLTNAHKPVHSKSTGGKLRRGGFQQTPYYVRMKVVPFDMATALDKAKPMIGETVLNTIPLT